MPELPEVEALAAYVHGRTAGREVLAVEVGSISALKTFDPAPAALVGRTVTSTSRHGKWLDLATDGPATPPRTLHLVFHLARAGWLRWHDSVPAKQLRLGNPLTALRVRLDDGSGFDLTEAGTRKRLAAFVVGDPADVPQVAMLGIDPLAAEFTPAALAALLAARNQQVKGLLRDQRTIAGIGNAYSDEILLVARTSPFALTKNIGPKQVSRLHAAVVDVLREAVSTASGRPAAELKDAKRRGMRVHGRAGLPCPGWNGEPCGDVVHEVSFADSALHYCPTCQTGGKPLADRRMSRLLR